MPSIQYFNQSAPFWDFIASFEDQAFKSDSSSTNKEQQEQQGQAQAQASGTEEASSSNTTNNNDNKEAGEGSGEKKDEQHQDQAQEKGHGHGQQHPCQGGRNWQRRGHCGGGGGGHGHGFRRGGPGHCGGRGAWGAGYHPRGPWGGNMSGMGGGFNINPFVEFLESQLNGVLNNNNNNNNDTTTDKGDDTSIPKDFQPPVDVFSTSSAYHIHVSLPGAKKEDVGLNYNADKSELSIAGVIYRPGDEEFLKTLSMGERKIGVFDRKVRLGNERHPAEIDIDGITAKMEDGVLRIELPRLEKDYVDVKKVDIE
ncbi:MAG: hypothetical protein M1823_000663 [Watsoniomyces obsoletus]|nr:MAG: hypothetical protein M1823_000663 [Watsoniomyces obsoletus]